jgi:transposase
VGNLLKLSIIPQPFFAATAMKKADQKQKARAVWIRTYEDLGSISKAARRCGIARSTLQRWLKRLPQEGLADRSRRPQKLARQKWDDEVINLILDIRDTYRFGKIRICSHLLQHHQIKISPSTVERILKRYGRRQLKRYRKTQSFKRYAKDILGERVQIDVCKIATGIYQYTAVDDCSRFRVMHTYKRRTAGYSGDTGFFVTFGESIVQVFLAAILVIQPIDIWIK